MTDNRVDMLVKPIPKSRRSKNPDEEWIELSQTPTVELQRSATIKCNQRQLCSKSMFFVLLYKTDLKDGMREGGVETNPSSMVFQRHQIKNRTLRCFCLLIE